MGSKRSYEEHDGAAPTGEGYSRHHDSGFSKHPRKKHKNGHLNHKHKRRDEDEDDAVAYGKTRKRARDIRRLLKRDEGLPANVRKDLERELAAHETTLDERDVRRKRADMITRYHMVRFFERQKAERLAKKVKKRLDAATDAEEVEKLKADLHITEVDIAYTKYFPYLERYIALYPKRNPEEKSQTEKQTEQQTQRATLDTPRPPLWKAVEAAMEAGDAELETLRERQDAFYAERVRRRDAELARVKKVVKVERKEKVEKEQKEERGGVDRKAEDSSSDDGGFFEED